MSFRSSSVSGRGMVGSKTNNSISSNSSSSRPPLSKASTQLQLINERGGVAVKQLSQLSMEAPAAVRSSSQLSQWIPDYTLTALTDTTYLKVRRNTYLVAVKASKMELGRSVPDAELEEVLVKITENDDDFCVRSSSKQCVRSPDSSWSQLRRDSVLSTISNIRAKLGSRRDTVITNNSFENIREERFWEILGNNSDTGQEGSRRPRANKKVLNRGNTLPGGRASNGDITMVTRRQISDSPREFTNTDLTEATEAHGDKESDSPDSPNDKSNLLPDK